jgi:hypothetical protein
MSMFLLRYVQPLPASLFELLTVQLNAQDYVQFRVVRNHHDVVFIIAKSPAWLSPGGAMSRAICGGGIPSFT